MTIQEREALLEAQWAWLDRHEDDIDQTAYEAGVDQLIATLKEYEAVLDKAAVKG